MWETIWFSALVFMLTCYIVLDGFDLGAGVLHLLAAKNNEERKTILNAIGPLWDGNEVWLIGAGGVLYLAFPRAYALSFSGFYLPFMIVLWCLMLRALAIEFRRHIENELWQSFWDVVFFGSSLLLCILFGAALGNVLRGVTFDASGNFFAPLWTTFDTTGETGVLDWYTILIALVAVAALSVHGSLFLAYKTTGDLLRRCRILSHRLWPFAAALSLAALAATCWIRPGYLQNFEEHPAGLAFPAAAGISLLLVLIFARRHQDGRAFLASCVFLSCAGAATAFALFPVLLASSGGRPALTVFNSSSGEYGLRMGARWLAAGIPLVLVYFAYLYYTFRGKVSSEHRGH